MVRGEHRRPGGAALSYPYRPSVGFGPLRFGMSPPEIRAHCGEPASFVSATEIVPVSRETARYVRHLRFMRFPDTLTSNAFPEVTFQRDRAVAFTLFHRRDPVMLDGIDLFAADRGAVLAALAARESTYYGNGEYFFFPKAAVTVPARAYARRLPSITLVDPAHEMERLDHSMLAVTRELGP